ncbi:ABC transporter permease [Streptococcus sp. IMAU 99161]|uniref:ABC transporter permease n=1 Tax=Streptococcus sp. IMAU 99161 TaxID=2710601 RepID=UPI001655B422|nr:ABC transporter permease [Streptococcus sp. IMAU 99161]MBC8775365.1 ABC transporter permease [Streptococcus sp. IMAU 99161]
MFNVLKKILTIFVLFIGISFVVFLLIHMAPSDPASVKMSVGTGRVSTDALARMREEMGLNQPLLVQYGNWLLKFLQGDFGKSLISDIPTKNLMIPAVMNTVQLAVITLMVSLGISIPLSIFFVRCQNRIVKVLFQLILFFNMSLPSFVIGYFLMYVFSVQLRWVPLLAKQGGSGLILPVITLVIPMSAKFIQQFSALLEQELQQEYVKVLYYRGIDESKIFRRHLLKNIFPTMVTIILLSFASLMAGVVVVETIFYWPGIGKLLMDSISSRDYPLVQMIVVSISFLYLVLTQISDGIQNRTDTRIKGGELS